MTIALPYKTLAENQAWLRNRMAERQKQRTPRRMTLEEARRRARERYEANRREIIERSIAYRAARKGAGGE